MKSGIEEGRLVGGINRRDIKKEASTEPARSMGRGLLKSSK